LRVTKPRKAGDTKQKGANIKLGMVGGHQKKSQKQPYDHPMLWPISEGTQRKKRRRPDHGPQGPGTFKRVPGESGGGVLCDLRILGALRKTPFRQGKTGKKGGKEGEGL